MAAPSPTAATAEPAGPLIGGGYAVDLGRPLPGAGAGVAAFAVRDRRSGPRALMALAVPPGLPPRAGVLAGFGVPIDGLLGPLAHGPGPRAGGPAGARDTYVVCPAPPGPSLAAGLVPWPEAALLDQVLRPAARALDQLGARGLTHRAIRPDNVFRAAPGRPVVLGAAWAAPAAMHQPDANEPPYVAMCLPAGRGEGRIADDVYALGVLLLTLAIGAAPLAGLDPALVIRRKLELGSFEALVGAARLPALLGTLLRGMLADDPEHRPVPAQLADPAAVRSRPAATRPPRRARQPLRIGAVAASGARSLAYAIATAPEAGARALRSGAVDLWLRRDLGDTALSARLDAAVRRRATDRGGSDARAEALLLVRAVAALDPMAPVCGPGAAIWPDGVGPALAVARATADPRTDSGADQRAETRAPPGAGTLRPLVTLIQAEAVGAWAEARGGPTDLLAVRTAARQWHAWQQTPGPGGGLARLVYALNPLLPCASPLLAGGAVTRLAELPAALDAAATPTPPAGDGPVDPEIMAFVVSRQEQEQGANREHAIPTDRATGTDPARVPPLAQMEIMARLQTRFHPGPLPGLARWLAAMAAPLAADWRHQARRAEAMERLTALSAAGLIAPMLALLRDPPGRAADLHGFQEAAREVARIDATLGALETGAPERAALARRWGQELAAGIGIAALAAVLGLAALG